MEWLQGAGHPPYSSRRHVPTAERQQQPHRRGPQSRSASGPLGIALSAPGGGHDGGPDLVGIGDADEVRAGAWNLSGTRPVPPHVRGRRDGR
ncbi:hypothetical protein [Streptomyces sp. NBC_01589]|uniref:hypothetical protein n=1 Tax=unclassified Streptomyces TaxID=2593676 RepID=UPI00386CA24A